MQKRAAIYVRVSTDKQTVENQVAAEVVAAYKTLVAAARRMKQVAPAVAEGLESLRLNLVNTRRGAGLPAATRPIEVLQSIQALAQVRTDYLDSVVAHNRAQFRLYRALGRPPLTFPAPSPPASGLTATKKSER